MRNRISMMHSSDYNRCRQNCGLTPDEGRIMDMMRREASNVEMAMALNTSTASISRRKRSLHAKIDVEL